MDTEALKSAYNLAVKRGYKKTIEDFKVLLSTDDEALNDIHSEVSKLGYKKDINEFSNLLGVKKNKIPKYLWKILKKLQSLLQRVV